MRKNKTTQIMSGVLIVLFAGIFLIISGRFLYIQATGEIDGVSLEKWADEKRTASYTLDAERGKIYDRNGMTLAYDRPTYRIQAIIGESHTQNEDDPLHVVNPEKTAEKLAPLLDADKSYLLGQMQDGKEQDQFQVEFGSAGNELSQATKEKIEKLDLPGVKFIEEPVRYYPNGMFASHVIGFAQKEDDAISGVTGVESQLNTFLGGKDGSISYERDQYDNKLLHPDEVVDQPQDGGNVYLTIDQKVQTLLEDAMTQMNEAYSPERMTAAVMDPETGKILAMSNRPSYNPNNPDDVDNWYNDIIATPVEPGSTMKMFTWASAIDQGVYNGDEWLESGTYKISDRVAPVEDYKQDWGAITYDEGFIRSSNVAASKLVWEEMGTESYLSYLKAFGFADKTGINLPGEETGKLVYNYPRDKITTAFGQASTVTPIQQLKAASAIANDGKMVRPYVISEKVNPATGETTDATSTEVAGEPISDKTADHMMNLLGSVVSSDKGTGRKYRLDDYSIAGKTGTAQITEDGRYLAGHGNYMYSFLGMAPRKDPQLMMFVSVKQPDIDASESGSDPAAFIFKNVMKNSLHYLDITPDKDTEASIEPVQMPKLTGEKTASVQKELEGHGLKISVIGSGSTIKEASAAKGDELLPGDRIVLMTNKPKMPDIIGWSLRDVIQLADLTGLEVDPAGNGYVTAQSIETGTPLKQSAQLEIELEPPASDDETANETE